MNQKRYEDVYFWIFITSLIFTFGGSFFFGVLGKPIEMGIILAAGVSGMAFSNINKIHYFRIGKWMEFMMRKVEFDMQKMKETISQPEIPQNVRIKFETIFTDLSANMASIATATGTGIETSAPYRFPWEKEYANGDIGETASPISTPKSQK